MSMFPVTAERGSFMPQQRSFTQVERRRLSLKDVIPKRPSFSRSSFSRKGSKAKNTRTGSFALERSFSAYDPLTEPPVDGDPVRQEQSLFFSKLPYEVRLQIYEEVIGSKEIYHFRNFKELYSFRCPRGPVEMKRGPVFLECENGHPWTERPCSLLKAREFKSHPVETKSALLLTCRQAYLEVFDCLYKRSRFCFSGPESLLSLCRNIITIRSTAGMERIQAIELRAPDLLAWRLRLEHPKENKAGFNDWMECLKALKQMRSLRALYVIVPNYGTRKKHSVEIERSFLEHFRELPTIQTFMVWLAWYDDEGRGYPRGDAENERYAFEIVRFESENLWPEPFVESDKTGDGVGPWVDTGRL